MTTPTLGNNAQKWLDIIHQMAVGGSDGHLTIMAFTTGWKAMLGTPELSSSGREELGSMVSWPTLEDALRVVYQDVISEVVYWNDDAALHGETVEMPPDWLDEAIAKVTEIVVDDPPTYEVISETIGYYVDRWAKAFDAVRASLRADPQAHALLDDLRLATFQVQSTYAEFGAQAAFSDDPDDRREIGEYFAREKQALDATLDE